MIDNDPRPISFVLAATEHGPLIVNLNHFDPRTGGGLTAILVQQGAYDRYELARVKELLHLCRKARGDGVVAIDCGANIGIHTVEMACQMYGWGKVIAFEPQELLYYTLAGNIVLANLFNVSAIHAAVGAGDGTIDIPVPDYRRPGDFGSLELRPGRSQFIGQPISYAPKDLRSVRLMSIDGLELPRVDYIKIDVEGMEMEVLEGAVATIARDHPTMYIEWIKVDKPKLQDWLETRGYRVSEFGINFVAEHDV